MEKYKRSLLGILNIDDQDRHEIFDLINELPQELKNDISWCIHKYNALNEGEALESNEPTQYTDKITIDNTSYIFFFDVICGELFIRKQENQDRKEIIIYPFIYINRLKVNEERYLGEYSHNKEKKTYYIRKNILNGYTLGIKDTKKKKRIQLDNFNNNINESIKLTLKKDGLQ